MLDHIRQMAAHITYTELFDVVVNRRLTLRRHWAQTSHVLSLWFQLWPTRNEHVQQLSQTSQHRDYWRHYSTVRAANFSH